MPSLNILIAGAGIGGLTAAIGLRRQGHTVTVFERSSFKNELGAAIHLAPNANGILRRFGLNAEDIGGVEMRWLTEYDSAGNRTRDADVGQRAGMWQHSWLLSHRVHLHNKLKAMATAAGAADGLDGPPAALFTSCPVVDVDCEAGRLVLASGETRSGDVIVVADGVHSTLRSRVIGREAKPFPSGWCAYRFLVPREVVRADPTTARFADRDGQMILWNGIDRRVVMYSCHGNSLLNFVCIHPNANPASDADDGWNRQVDKTGLLEEFSSFDPALLALLNKANPETVRLWRLLDLERLPTWVSGRVCLLGDAAHPLLPYLAQGGAQAIEDAASLAAMLPRGGVDVAEIPDRLRLYEQCRCERVAAVQEYTRQSGCDRDHSVNDSTRANYTMHSFGHDEWHHSTAALHRWLLARNPHAHPRSPLAAFGPVHSDGHGGCGGGCGGGGGDGTAFVTASIKFKTSRTMLQTLFPTDDFSFQSPATVAYATLAVTTLRDAAAPGGRGGECSRHRYELYVHGVQYKSARDRGTVYSGSYLIIVFEDPTAAASSCEGDGQGAMGWPRLFAALDVSRSADTAYSLVAAWRGVPFARFALRDLQDAQPTGHGSSSGDDDGDEGVLWYRYVPAVGEPGKSDAEYAVFAPPASGGKAGGKRYLAREASFSFQSPPESQPQDDGKGTIPPPLPPTLAQVVATLAQVPVYAITRGQIVEGTGTGGLVNAASPRRI